MSANQGETLIYCRISERTAMLGENEDPQVRWRKALKLQLRQCEEFAVQLGYNVAGHVEEISDGFNPESEGLEELYSYAEDGAIKYVLLTDPSRFSFDAQTRTTILKRLASLHVQVVYAAV
jgi:DNA invertase Pin-like site-specific DNA recombinase